MPDAPREPALDYAPAANFLRVRGVRLLIVLTLVNTILLGGYVLGPQFLGFAQAQWSAYQQRRADDRIAAARAAAESARATAERQARLAVMPAEARAMDYAAEPDGVLYDDDPARHDPTADALAGDDAPRWPATTTAPAAFTDAFGKTSLKGRFPRVPLFLHGRRATPDGERRLVAVVCGPVSLDSGNVASARVTGLEFTCESRVPTTPDAASRLRSFARYAWGASPDYKASVRLLAGRSDPADAGRFTVPYEVVDAAGGVARGSLHGQLQADGLVRLLPDGPLREGWRVDTARRFDQHGPARRLDGDGRHEPVLAVQAS